MEHITSIRRRQILLPNFKSAITKMQTTLNKLLNFCQIFAGYRLVLQNSFWNVKFIVFLSLNTDVMAPLSTVPL